MGEDEAGVPALMMPDAAWKNIQQNTFTRWVNKHLNKSNLHVDDLERDLSDGLRLIKLVEVLSHKEVGKYNKKVSFRSQKLENVSVALIFLQTVERIKIVNIDSSHIVDSNRKLILGLIWTLIVHYSMSTTTWEELPEGPASPSHEQTPKQRLLAWIRSKLPSDVPVTNFTSDWNDGLALGALVDVLAPSQIGDWRNWNPDDAVSNTKKAMGVAEEDLGIAQLITPDELINPNIDEKSVMTYLAQFPQAKRPIPKGRLVSLDKKPLVGFPAEISLTVPSEHYKPKLTIKDEDGKTLHFTLTKTSEIAYIGRYTPERKGKHEIELFVVDVQSGDGKGSPDASVTVQARQHARLVYNENARLGEGSVKLTLLDAEGATADDLDVVVIPPSGEEEKTLVVGSSENDSVFTASYTPIRAGLHSLNVFQERRPIKGSPFPLRVKGHGVGLRAWGRGLATSGIVKGENVEVNVDEDVLEEGAKARDERDLGELPIRVVVTHGSGSSHEARLLPSSSPSIRKFAYCPPSSGDYTVEVLVAEEHLGSSPYKVSVRESTRSGVRAFGPGLEGGVAMLPSVFFVEGNGEQTRLGFAVEGPSETEIRCEDRGNSSAIVEYTPAKPGVYSVSILADDEHIKHSPFVILVDPADLRLRPSAVSTAGLDDRSVYPLGKPIEFEIDTTHASDTLLIPSVSVLDANLLPVETTITQLVPTTLPTSPLESPSSASGLFSCVFQPTHIGQHYVSVAVKGVSVPGSPFPVMVVDPSKLRIYGPGVEGHVVSQQPTHFTIDAKQAGPGTLEVALRGDDGKAVDIDVLDNEDGSFTVKYTAPRPGAYQLKVVFAGAELPNVEINVKPHVDHSGIRVEGLENAIVTVNCEKEVHVFTSNGEKTRIEIRAPSGRVLEAIIEPSEKGLRVRFTPPEIGDYKIDVTCEDLPPEEYPPCTSRRDSAISSPTASFHFQAIEDALVRLQEALPSRPHPSPSSLPSPLVPSSSSSSSPSSSSRRRRHSHESEYLVSGTGPPRADLVRVFGPGLGPVAASMNAIVYIDASQAGLGDIDLFVDGPTRTPIHCVDNHNGTCVMNYVPRRPGMYWLRVLFDGRHVTGSPFQIVAVPPLLSSSDTGDVRSDFSISSGSSTPHGEIIEVLIGQTLDVCINTSGQETYQQGVEVVVVEGALSGRKESAKNLKVVKGKDGLYRTKFTPEDEGFYTFGVYFDGIAVLSKKVTVKGGYDARKVRTTGLGLERAVVGRSAEFDVDISNAGVGKLHVEITGPDEVVTKIKDNGDGTATVEYVARTPGMYTLAIMYGDEKHHVPGSPFRCLADHPKHIDSVLVRGLEKLTARAGKVKRFVVNAAKTQEAAVAARLPVGQQQPFVVERREEKRVFDVHFTPSLREGEHGKEMVLDVLYGGEHVNGSPFHLTILPESDPQAIRFITPQSVPASRDGVILIDKTEAGNVKDLEIEITGPDGRRRRYEVSPTATEDVDELRFRTDIPGEYFVVLRRREGDREAVNKTKLTAVAKGRKEDATMGEKPSSSLWEIGKEEDVVVKRKVDDTNARIALLETSGHGVEYAVDARIAQDGGYEDVIRIRPRKSGKHVILVLYGGVQVDVIEFEALSREEKTAREKEEKDKEVAELERRYYEASLNSVPSSPPSKPPRSPQIARERNNNDELDSPNRRSSRVQVNEDHFDERVFPFDFDPSEIHAKQLKAVIEMPSGTKDTAEIIDNHDGTVLVKYTPKTSGNHILSILHEGIVVQGTPISFYVDKYTDGYATIYGPGTQGGVVGEPAHFTVCAKHGHAKELSVSIEGPAQANIKIHDNKDGTCSVSWVPPLPGEYKVHVKLAGRELDQSPFRVLVAGEGSKRAHLSVGSTSEVALNITESELKGISASIKSPSGIEEPCFVRIIEGGRLGVSFTPREAGEHLITVKRNGKLVPKAPFKIKVDKSQVGDASKVEVTGEGRSKALTQQWNEMLIDTTKAGYGGLSVSVQGPSKAELQCKEKKTGLVQVLYKPSEPGVYAVAIKFADHHVQSSPFTVHCTGASGGAVREEIKKKVEQSPISLVNQEAHIYLKLPNTSPMDTVARLMDPKGNTEDVELRDEGGCFYLIKMKPKVEGPHALSILHKDAHVNGSPFQFTVGSFTEGGAHKVRASGLGVVRGETTNWQTFNVYSREAGPGNLSVAIEGPSRATLKFEDHKDGNCHVDYKVTQPGEYVISVKFNDAHIPDSPFKVFIAPATGEVRKLELASFHDTGIPVGKAFTFTVLTHRARGHLEAKVLTPNGETDTIDIVPIEDGESYALRFVPKESGNHYIHVTLDGAPMRDSPFRLRVGGKDECDPTAIHASGEGLLKGTTGQKCEFIVTTANAGGGILTIQMDGPSKVTLDAYELDTGYKARYTPLAPGDYYAMIKYNGIHVPGSPFKIHVDGKVLGGNGYNETAVVKIDALAKTSKGTVAVAPEYKGDASKVSAKGAGLNKFFPGRPAMFTIDTALAGTNLLFVGVVTSKGPCEEVVVKHQGNGHYICTYRIQERVKGFVFIKYGDQDVPGSPFALSP